MEIGQLIYFYLDKKTFSDSFPQNRTDLFPNFLSGEFAWILQTYLVLKVRDQSVILTSVIPSEGIIFAHRDHLPIDLAPSSSQLFVCVQADRDRHPLAQIHLVQNPKESKFGSAWNQRWLSPLGLDYFVRHWPQPGLVPRDISRDDVFQNVGYFGVKENSDRHFGLEEWKVALRGLQLNWLERNYPGEWNDYSKMDCLIAVRSFSNNELTPKPATKLYNAWHAGVPAIVDTNSAYQFEMKSKLDFLVANDLNAVIAHLKFLKTHRDFYHQMIKNGKERAKETSEESLALAWTNLINTQIIPFFKVWKSSAIYRQTFFSGRKMYRDLSILKRNLMQP